MAHSCLLSNPTICRRAKSPDNYSPFVQNRRTRQTSQSDRSGYGVAKAWLETVLSTCQWSSVQLCRYYIFVLLFTTNAVDRHSRIVGDK